MSLQRFFRVSLFATVLTCLAVTAAVPATAQSFNADRINKITALGGPLDKDDEFGIDVASIGDVDGDGIADALVGAHLDDDGAADPTDDRFNGGAAYVLFMRADGTVDRWQKLSMTEGMPTGFALDKNDRFGIAVAGIGDLNADGVPDVAVGAHDDDDGEGGAGAIYIVLLNSNGTAAAVQKISNTVGTPPGFSLGRGEAFGTGIARIGDLDGDGIDEVAVGAPEAEYTPDGTDFNRVEYGAVYILFLNGPPTAAGDSPVGTVRKVQEVSESDALTYASPSVYDSNGNIDLKIEGLDLFGASVAPLGDINDDGVPDMIVGAPEGEDRNRGFGTFTNFDSGALHVITLDSSGEPTSVGLIEGDDPSCSSGDPACLQLGFDTYLGASVDAVGDLNGDGGTDVIVGAAKGSNYIQGNGDRARSPGDAYVLFLAGPPSDPADPSGGSLLAYQKVVDLASPVPGLDLRELSDFGTGIAALGDLDGSGLPTVLAGVRDDNSGTQTGAAFTLPLNADGTAQSGRKISNETDLNTDGDLPLDFLDEFGQGAAPIGDLNGDGVPDVAVTVLSGNYVAGVNESSGGVYILFLDTNGDIKDYQAIFPEPGTTFDPPIDTNDDFATSVAGVGDIDDDGTPDLFVGAPEDDDGDTAAGAGFVLFLNGPPAQPGDPAAGTVRAYQKISALVGGPSGGLALDRFDRFGAAAAGIGDLDGDQIPDLAVGAPDDDVGPDRVGTVYILFMNRDGTVRAAQKLGPGSGMPSGFALDSGDEFGGGVGTIGSLNTGTDATVDLVVGAPGDDDGGGSGFDAGAVYILFLDTDGTAKAVQKISQTEGAPASLSLLENQFMGESSAGVGDVDGDGIPDVLVGSPNNDDGGGGSFGFDAGAVRVFFLDRDGTATAVQKISNTAGAPPSLLFPEDGNFGASIAALGDLDGDGTPNVFVGAPEDNTNVLRGGAGYIFSLQPDGTLPTEPADLVASVTRRLTPADAASGTEVAFAGTGVAIDVAGGTSPGTVTVSLYSSPPTGTGGITESTVSSYRLIITAREGLTPGRGTRVRFDASRFAGITDPTTVSVYARPTVGSGSFTALTPVTFDPSVGTEGELSVPVTSFSEFVFASDDPGNSLPVELAAFTAVEGTGGVALTWQTASETENAGFHVQRQTGGGAFTDVHFAPGAGTTTAPQSYRFVDQTVPFAAEQITYRLRQVDTDGTTTLSDAVEVTLGAPTRATLHAPYPNPARSGVTLRVEVPEATAVELTVYDVLGRQVAMLADGVPASRRIERRLDARRLPSGMYFVRLVAGGEVRTQRLTVLH